MISFFFQVMYFPFCLPFYILMNMRYKENEVSEV